MSFRTGLSELFKKSVCTQLSKMSVGESTFIKIV